MFPFTFFISEDIAILGFVICSLLALYFSYLNQEVVQSAQLPLVGLGLFLCLVLVLSGILGPYESPWDTLHRVAGHMCFPVTACAFGVWLGTSIQNIARHPFRILRRLVALLLLCFCCFSNVRTGYLGPSRIDPLVDAATNIRFSVLHKVAFPLCVGCGNASWFYRLVRRRIASGE